MSNRYAQIDPRDNIIVAIQDLSKGEEVSVAGQTLTLTDDIQAKHKFALKGSSLQVRKCTCTESW